MLLNCDANVGPLTVDEDEPFNFDLATISSDEDGDKLSYEILNGPNWLQSDGAILSARQPTLMLGLKQYFASKEYDWPPKQSFYK